jgi:RHS repeat-associated protein
MEGNWNGAQGNNKYQYNQKEWNDDFGLGWNDYGARFYDPSVARWWNVDPLSDDEQESWNAYHYAYNSPIVYIDLYGLSPSEPSKNDNLSICNTCPKSSEYDKYRESKAEFTYDKECNCVINGNGQAAIVSAKRASYDYNDYSGFLYGTGHSLNFLGDNRVPTRGKLGGATPGTSIASLYFRQSLRGKKTPPWLLKALPKRIGVTKTYSMPIRSTDLGAVAGRTVPLLGRGLVGVNAGMSIYSVYNAENKAQALTVEAGGWAGTYVGAEAGSAAGAAIGVWFGGAGAVPGAVIGAIIGGGIGYVAGAEAGQAVYNKTNE